MGDCRRQNGLLKFVEMLTVIQASCLTSTLPTCQTSSLLRSARATALLFQYDVTRAYLARAM